MGYISKITIRINETQWQYLTNLCNKLSMEKGSRVSMNSVIKDLIDKEMKNNG